MNVITSEAIRIIAGDTYVWTLTAEETDPNDPSLNTPVNLTGATVQFQVRKKEGDADPPLIYKFVNNGIVIFDALNGKCRLTLESSDSYGGGAPIPGAYRCDCVAQLANGNRKHLIEPKDFFIDGTVTPPP